MTLEGISVDVEGGFRVGAKNGVVEVNVYQISSVIVLVLRKPTIP